jgi:hypothetical protein
MGDADKIQGYVGPVPPEPEKDTIKANGDKFKREMIKKVDASTFFTRVALTLSLLIFTGTLYSTSPPFLYSRQSIHD